MTPDQFRRLALSLPGAVEEEHQGHPDFRVGKKIFATLGHPDEAFAMVKLTPQQQARVLTEHPEVFEPANGTWGRQGSTLVRLKRATKPKLFAALVTAWRNLAPADLVDQFK